MSASDQKLTLQYRRESKKPDATKESIQDIEPRDNEKRKRTIVFVHYPHGGGMPPTGRGGLNRRIYEVAKRLAEDNNVCLIARLIEGQERESSIHGLQIFRIDSRWHDMLIHRIGYYIDRLFGGRVKPLSRTFHSLLPMLKVAMKVRKINPDIIFFLNYSQYLPILRHINPRSKLVLHMTCDWLSELDQKTVEKRLTNADMVLGISKNVADLVKKAQTKHKDKCSFWYGGVDMNHFTTKPQTEILKLKEKLSLKESQKIVLYVGRITPEKGIHVLIRAMEKINRVFPDVVLVLAGAFMLNPVTFRSKPDEITKQLDQMKSDYETTVRRLAEKMLGRIIFMGHVSYEELPLLYSAADVFVFPSIWEEPFGNPPIEAMACNTPVVATRVGGIPEFVIDGFNGRVVRKNDEHELADALIELLSDKELCQKLVRNGRRYVAEKFTWEHCAKNLLKHFERLYYYTSPKRVSV